jgi:hypothetical protein
MEIYFYDNARIRESKQYIFLSVSKSSMTFLQYKLTSLSISFLFYEG